MCIGRPIGSSGSEHTLIWLVEYIPDRRKREAPHRERILVLAGEHLVDEDLGEPINERCRDSSSPVVTAHNIVPAIFPLA